MVRILRSEAGVTLVEAMIAGALVMIIAVAILPGFAQLNNSAKISSFRVACNAMVKAKLNEYVTGSGNLGTATGGRVLNGWQYTKFRLQDTTTVTTACRDPFANPNTPGFREAINSSTVMADTAPTDANIPADLLGFQLWVNLRRYNPRVGAAAQPIRDCMSAAERNGVSQDNLISVGDAVEITVTGMIRTDPARAAGGRSAIEYGGLRDLNAGARPNPVLTCSASQLIYPNRSPFRYYLGTDGKIRNTQSSELNIGTGASGIGSDASIEAHFRSLWSSVPGATGLTSSQPLAGINGFAVSADNQRVYLLRQGSLALHTGCTRQLVTVNGIAFNGAPDCPATATSEWGITNNTVDAITVDFRDLSTDADDIVYGLLNTGPTTTTRRIVSVTGLPATPPASPLGASIEFLENANYTLPNIPRLISIFLVSNFPQTTPPSMFVADPSCYTGPAGSTNNSTFCVRVYNATDTSLSYDMADLTVQALAFSN